MKALNSGISPGEAFLRTVGGGIIGHELSTVNLSTIVNFSITSIKHLVDANYINKHNWPVFKTLDAAAYGFSKYLIGGGAFSNGVPKDYQNREFSSILYSFTGKEPSGTVKTFYSFTRPETSNGSVHKSPGPKDLKALVPNGGTPEAHIHNHLPDFSGSYASMENRRFSKNSILEKRDEYMVATNPDLQFYLLNSWGEIYIQREISQFSQIEDLFIAEGFYTGKPRTKKYFQGDPKKVYSYYNVTR